VIEARFRLDEYTTRVLDVVKGKFGLKNRDEALKKFAEECGSSFVEPIPKEEVLLELDSIYEQHKKKHKNRKMNNNELKDILNI